jgi:hypothetical protein
MNSTLCNVSFTYLNQLNQLPKDLAGIKGTPAREILMRAAVIWLTVPALWTVR